MNVKTGFYLKTGEEVNLGDILSSELTQDVVVMYHTKQQEYVAKVIDMDLYFPLGDFVSGWHSLKIKRNIILI